MKRILLIICIVGLTLSGLVSMSGPHTAEASRPLPPMGADGSLFSVLHVSPYTGLSMLVGRPQYYTAQLSDTSATGTPSSTSTVTPSPNPTPSPTSPTPTATPTIPPKAAAVLRTSIKAMSAVHQMHAEGTMTDGFGAKDASTFTADCGIPAQKLHYLGHGRDSRGTLVGVEIIKIGVHAWARSRTGNGAWSKWIALEGDAQLVLIYVVQSCPQLFSSFGKGYSHVPHLKNVGQSTVDGVATWHLQAHTKSQGEPVRFNVYVDQTTFVWRRYTLSQIAPKKKDTVVEDTRYSHFNEPVTINAPVG